MGGAFYRNIARIQRWAGGWVSGRVGGEVCVLSPVPLLLLLRLALLCSLAASPLLSPALPARRSRLSNAFQARC